MKALRQPLTVHVIWTDAASLHKELPWDLAVIAEEVDLCRGRHTVGFFVYIDQEKLVLSKDYDAATNEVGNLTVIPLGWVERIYTSRKSLYGKGRRRADT